MNFFDQYYQRFPLQLETLGNARKQGRFAHTFLLHADSPLLRKDFALLLAMIAACPDTIRHGRPCGTCRICRELQEGRYAERFDLTPVGKMRQIQVGDVRNPEPNTVRYFEEQFYLTSLESDHTKIGVIVDADRLGDEAQNALLKTLEEPPENTTFILATGNPAALLPTTRSRCQTVMVLENHCHFTFAGAADVFMALYNLYFTPNGGVAAAADAAEVLIRIAGQLEDSALRELTPQWQPRIAQAKDFDPALAKRLDKQFESAVAGLYTTSRMEFLEAIRTFCSQMYLLSCGAELATLPNPEIFTDLPPIPMPLSENRLAAREREAEKLLFNLQFNVSESLALQNFCLQCAMR